MASYRDGFLFESSFVYEGFMREEQDLHVGGNRPVKIDWQPVMPLFKKGTRDINPNIPDNKKGLYIIYKNGKQIRAGGAGVDKKSGSIRERVSRHITGIKTWAEPGDVFSIRIGYSEPGTLPQKLKIAEHLMLRKLNNPRAGVKRADLRNPSDRKKGPLKVQRRTIIKNYGGRNIPPALRTKSGKGSKTLVPGKAYEIAQNWLFEVLYSPEADPMAKQRDAGMTAEQRAVILQAIEAKMAKEEHKKGARKSTRDDHQQALARKKAAKMARAMRVFRTQGFEAALADAKR